MYIRTFLAVILALLWASASVTAQTASDPNEGSILTRDPSTGAYTFSWWGHAGRTYFLQQTDSLLSPWTYLPLIEPGANQSIQWGFTSTAPAFFVRLKYTDIPTTDPFNDDFDGDGVSNWDELMQGTDPLSWKDSDGDGIPDDWEVHYGLNPAVNDAGNMSTSGVTNLVAYQQGRDPNKPSIPDSSNLISLQVFTPINP